MGNFYSQSNTSPSFVSKSEYDTYVSTTPRVLDLNTVLADPTLTQKLLTALASDSRFIGPQGIQGQIGSQGSKGDTGPQGLQGSKGDTGPTGLQGAKGDTGPQGTKGDTGPQGLQGVKGDTGPQGLQGLQGTKGDTGPQGLQGLQGLQGTKGDTGPTGPQGPSIDPNQSYSFKGIYTTKGNPSNNDPWSKIFFQNRETLQNNINRDLYLAIDQDDYVIMTTKSSSNSNLNINPVFGGNVRIGYDPNDFWNFRGGQKDTTVPSSKLAVKGDISASGNLIGNGIKIGTNNSKICRASLTFNAYNGGTTNSNLTTLSSNGLSISRVNTAIFQINFTGDKPSDTNYIVTSFGIFNQPPMSGANMYGSSYNKTTNGFNLLISTRNKDNTEMDPNGTGFMDVCVFW